MLGLRFTTQSLARSLSTSPSILSKASKNRGTLTKSQKSTLKSIRPSNPLPPPPVTPIALIETNKSSGEGAEGPRGSEDAKQENKLLLSDLEELATAARKASKAKGAPISLLEDPSEEEQAKSALKAAREALRFKVEGSTSESEIAAALERRCKSDLA